MTNDQNTQIKEFIGHLLRNELEDPCGDLHDFLSENNIEEHEGLSQYEHHVERIEVLLGL